MFETIRRTFSGNHPNHQDKKTKNVPTVNETNDETDSSLSDDLKSIQNSIISINRPPSIVLKSFASRPSSFTSKTNLSEEDFPWLHENVTRETVENVLSSRPIGSFLVRRPTSMSSTNTFVLSIRVPKYMKKSCVVHYLIDQDHLGIRLRGTKKLFPTLNSFIVHHSIVPENLPVALDLRSYASLNSLIRQELSSDVATNEYVI